MSSPSRESFNPELFVYEQGRDYAWEHFPRVTIATVTFDRLEHTRRFVEAVYRYTHCPFELLIVDNASSDGTREFLRELQDETSNVRVRFNRRNLGKGRALLQIQKELEEGLLVYFDNDVELLSNYWLVHLHKAYHALHLARGELRASLGLRMINQEEYGFRFAKRREVLPIPSDRNDPPRTSYAVNAKESAPGALLAEEVVLAWTDFLCGGAWSCPVELFGEIPFAELYPKFLGGVDGFYSQECLRLGIEMAFIENGPITRHNDWPYSESKIELYRKLTRARAVVDWPLIRSKLRRLFRRGSSRS